MAIGSESEQSRVEREKKIDDFTHFMAALPTYIYDDQGKEIGTTLTADRVVDGNGFTNIYVQVGRSNLFAETGFGVDHGQYEFCLRVTADGFYPQFDPSVAKKLIELDPTLKFKVSYDTIADLKPFFKKLAEIAVHTRKINYKDRELMSSDKSLDRAILILKNMKRQDVKDGKDIKDATAALEKLKHNLPKLQFEDLKKYKDYFAILRKHIEDLESDARELNRVGIFNPEQGKDFKKTLVDIKTNLDKLESQFKDIKKELERRATSQRTNAHLGGPGIGPSQNFLLSQPGISTREFTSHVQKVLGAQLALFYTRHHNILSSKVKTDALLDTLKEWTEQINSARNNPRYQNNKELKKQIEKAKFDLEALSKAVQTAQKHRPSL